MNLLFYCHNSLGIGHLARTFKLAKALSGQHRVAVICGGYVPSALAVPPGVELFQLPIVSMTTEGVLQAEHDSAPLSLVMAQRQRHVKRYAHRFRTDVLVVEMFPFGRRKFSDEIIGLVETVRERTDAKVLASVRDVLVSRGDKQEAYDTRAVGWLNRHFDALLVHSDANVISLADTFTAYDRIAIPIHYTGFVAGTRSQTSVSREKIVVVSAGGGRVGQRLIDVACQASRGLQRQLGLSTLIIKGPKNPLNVVEGANAAFRCVEFTPDLACLLSSSTLSISQCGYNTATDVLAAEVPAVFVPFETSKEDEQLRRARLFAKFCRSVCLREIDLCVDTLIDAATRALDLSTATSLSLNGVAKTAAVIRQYHGR